MKTTAQYKAMARTAMRGRYANVIAAIMVSGMTTSVLTYVANTVMALCGFSLNALLDGERIRITGSLLVLFCILMTAVIFLSMILTILFHGGMIKLIQKAADRELSSLSDMMYGFRSPLSWRLVGIYFLTFLLVLIPVAVFTAMVMAALLIPMSSLFRILLMLAALAVYVLALLFIYLTFGLAAYVQIDCPFCTAFQSMKASARLVSGFRLKFLWLMITFIGWSVLSLLTLGIGQLWITPYSMCTYFYFYRDLKEAKNLEMLGRFQMNDS